MAVTTACGFASRGRLPSPWRFVSRRASGHEPWPRALRLALHERFFAEFVEVGFYDCVVANPGIMYTVVQHGRVARGRCEVRPRSWVVDVKSDQALARIRALAPQEGWSIKVLMVLSRLLQPLFGGTETAAKLGPRASLVIGAA